MTFTNMIGKKLSDKNQLCWDERLPESQFAYNTACHSSLGVSPFFLNHGRDAVYTHNTVSHSPAESSAEPAPWIERMTEMQDFVERHIIEAQQQIKLKDKLFATLKEEHPKFRHKIVAIKGDCTAPDLGISETDRCLLINGVSIIFHVAATLSFDEKIKLAVFVNVQSLKYMICMSKQMCKLKAFVHVSSAYAYCIEQKIEEKIYPSPIDAEKLITLMNCIDDNLAEKITPHLLGKWPNTYAYTKAVAENVVETEAIGMPVGIFRPAIVISTYQEPIKGWIDNFYGPTGVAAAAGAGLVRTLHCDGSIHANVVPGDMVVNALLSSVYDIAEVCKIKKEIPIYNYVSQDNPITYEDLKVMSQKYGLNYPSIRAIWYYSFRNNKYKIVHLFFVYFFHLLPALIIDSVTLCIGRRTRLLKIYKKIHKFMNVLKYFSTQEWKFGNNRMNCLVDRRDNRDKILFFCDIKNLVWDSYFKTYLRGIRIYLIKDPLDTLPEARIKWRRMYWIHQTVKLLLAYLVLKIIWGILLLIMML